MPYNIDISDNPGFNPSPINATFFQDWVILPSVNTVEWSQGSAVPPNVEVSVKIKNFYVDANFSAFTSFKIVPEVQYVQNSDAVNFIALSGGLTEVGGYMVTPYNLDTEVIIGFQSLNLLSVGLKIAYINLVCYGIAEGIETYIGLRQVSLKFTVNGENDISVTPGQVYFGVTEEELPANQVFTVNAPGVFTMVVPNTFSLSGTGVVLQSNINGQKTYTGSGDTAVTLAVTTVPDPLPFMLDYIQLSVTDGNTSGYLQIYFYTETLDNLEVQPSELIFNIQQGQQDIASQEIVIITTGTFTITNNTGWVYTSVDSGTGTQSVEIAIAGANNFSPGTYADSITITVGEVSIQVNITVNVSLFVNTTMAEGAVNFSKDLHSVNAYSSNANSIIKITMTMQVFKYASSSFQEYTYSGEVPFYEGNAVFYPGPVIHGLFKKLEAHSNYLPAVLNSGSGVAYAVYRPLDATILVEEINVETEEIRNSYEFLNYKWVKGITPEEFTAEGVLDLTTTSVRVTKNSVAAINFIKKAGSYQILIVVNGVESTDPGFLYTFSAQYYGVHTFLLKLDVFEKGDLIDVVIRDASVSFSKRLIVFPEGKESRLIGWENEYGCLQLLEFTGSYAQNTEMEVITNKMYRNLVRYQENTQVEKDVLFTINTGWLLMQNQRCITSLMRSRIAFWLSPDSALFKTLNVKTTKLANEDTNRELYEWDVEFIINRENDLQVY